MLKVSSLVILSVLAGSARAQYIPQPPTPYYPPPVFIPAQPIPMVPIPSYHPPTFYPTQPCAYPCGGSLPQQPDDEDDN